MYITLLVISILFLLLALILWWLKTRGGKNEVFSLRGFSMRPRKSHDSASEVMQRQNRSGSAILLPTKDRERKRPVPFPPASGDTPEYLLPNRSWLSLAEECVELFDELEEMMPGLDPSRQEIAQHIRLRLQEILKRTGLELIENDTVFDLGRHRLAVPGQPVEPGMPITEVISPGFALGRRVLRPARVNVDRTQTS